MGSIHALSKKDYPLAGAVRNRIKRQQAFPASNSIRTGMSNSKRNLRRPANILGDRISVQKLIRNFWPGFARMLWLSSRTIAGQDGNAVGISTASSAYKPWWIAQHLVGPATYSKSSLSHGLDNYFVDRATREKKEIAGLESVDEHVAVMGGLCDRDSEFILRDALDQPGNAEKEFSRMYKAWRKGNTDALWAGDSRLRKQAPWIAARFVDNRNVKWIPRIEAELKTGKPTAIVAGALHFSGPNSVIKLLEKRGYKIEQL